MLNRIIEIEHSQTLVSKYSRFDDVLLIATVNNDQDMMNICSKNMYMDCRLNHGKEKFAARQTAKLITLGPSIALNGFVFYKQE